MLAGLMPDERRIRGALSKAELIELGVSPRRPRLLWHGVEHREVAKAVPTEVMELVHPGAPGRDGGLPSNRLIWTIDNLVALQTLLDEQDPVTREPRYLGKVDLVYIDPPFMVQSDFRADDAIHIDGDDGVRIERAAYKDTWRQGLDSFLSMLRERLLRLKQLLAPTGSIYVHLDSRTVHYVKVSMDEIFGYQNFIDEIVWRSTNAHGDAKHLGHVHQTLLHYAVDPERVFVGSDRVPHSPDYIGTYFRYTDENGRRFMSDNVTAPGGRGPVWTWNGHTRAWRYAPETAAALEREGRIFFTKNGMPRLKRYMSEQDGMPPQSVWDDTDVRYLVSWSREQLGYPTQKPVGLLTRVLRLSSPPGGLVLDCFMGSGTTIEAAERLGRRWVGIDSAKHAVWLARKRLVQLHGRPRPPERARYDYVACEACGSIERKPRGERKAGTFEVRAFTVESMGVYRRAEPRKGARAERSEHREEMVRVFGGTPSSVTELLHGEKGEGWIHVGPFDSAIDVARVWAVAREAAGTDRKNVTVLSAGRSRLSWDDTAAMLAELGVRVRVRMIPASAVEEVERRIQARRDGEAVPHGSMTIHTFYSPLEIRLHVEASGRTAKLSLVGCEVDVESLLESQRPVLEPITDGPSAAARTKAQAERRGWNDRRAELERWLAAADSWQRFVDSWAVDWQHGRRLGPDGEPILESDWQSFRARRSKQGAGQLAFTAEHEYELGGRYRVAARVTDVFGNDGMEIVEIDIE
jgi:adenine-specific DNA-methyltransferase